MELREPIEFLCWKSVTKFYNVCLCFSSGATVYMVCRNKERGQEALSKIQTSTGNQNVYLEV